MTYPVNQLLTESISSNPQPQQKKRIPVKLVLHSLYSHCRRNRIIQAKFKLTVSTGTIFIQKTLLVINSVFETTTLYPAL